MANEDPTSSEPWNENTAWRNKQITQKQAQLLHDLICEMVSTMSRGDAADMIDVMLTKPGLNLSKKASFDKDTLEKHK